MDIPLTSDGNPPPESSVTTGAKTGGDPEKIVTDEKGKKMKQDEIDCDKSKVGKLIGHKGSVIQEISRRSGCEIVIPDEDLEDNETRKVKITSSNEDGIQVAKNLIENVIEHGHSALNSANTFITPYESLTMECPQDKVSSVIGARGTVINDIMRRTGCKVIINQDVVEGEPAIVEMKGHQPQLDEVKMLINKVIDDGPQSISLSPLLGLSTGPFANQIVTDVIKIPKYKVGVAIGTKGVIVQEIMKRTNCKVVIDQDVPDGQPCRVHFSGLPDQVQFAKALMSSVIKSGPSALKSSSSQAAAFDQAGPSSMQEMLIDQTHVGRILGTKGSIVKELQSRFLVKIKVEKSDDGSKTPEQRQHRVKVYGQMLNVQQACQTIHHIIEFGVESILGAKDERDENRVRNRAATYPTPVYVPPPSTLVNVPHVGGGVFYGDYQSVDQFSSSTKGIDARARPTVPLALGTNGKSGALLPMATMPNGLQSQSCLINSEHMHKVVGKNASTLNLIKSKSGAHVQSVQTVAPNAETNCEINFIGTPIEVELASQMVQEVLTSGKGKVEAMPDVQSATSILSPQIMPPTISPQFIQSYPAYPQQSQVMSYGSLHPNVPVYTSNMPPNFIPPGR